MLYSFTQLHAGVEHFSLSDYSGLVCPNCEQRFLKTYFHSIRSEVVCAGCACVLPASQRLDNTVLLESDHPLRKAPTALKAYWYHSTFEEKWDEVMSKKQLIIHLGTEESAIARAHHLHEQNLLPEYTLFTLKLKPTVRFRRQLTVDSVMQPRYKNLRRAVGYVNIFESPGSLSLMVNPAMFSIESRELRHF